MNEMWLSDEEERELKAYRVTEYQRRRKRDRQALATSLMFAAMGAILVVATLWGMGR